MQRLFKLVFFSAMALFLDWSNPVESSELVNAWRILDQTGIDGLAGKVDNLTTTNKWLDEDLDQSKLTQVLKDAPDGQKLIDNLSNSRSIYHAQVHVGDLDNISGVRKGTLTENGLIIGKPNPDWTNSDLDLPLDEAENFASAVADELPAGTKLYRVTGGIQQKVIGL